jgi:dihydrofolate synthase/folylpolyglutamate synthase
LELTLSRITGALDTAGFREESLGRIIHAAGTNGKGSTCRFIHDMLTAKGHKTSLFTSPHILRINERAFCEGEIPDADFNRIFTATLPLTANFKLSYFESLTLCSFLWFAEKKPEFSVIETGLGGRFDSTNVLDLKTPVITTIAKDHAAFLGSNIYGIADEKLAVIKDNSPVFIGRNTPSIERHIKEALKGKELVFTNESSGRVPEPYSWNLALAENVVKHLTGSLPENFEPSLPPCRQERTGRFILDGAHNPNGMLALMRSGIKFGAAVISSTTDRDITKLIKIIKPYCSGIVITEIPENSRSISLPLNVDAAAQEKDHRKALNIAVELAGNADILISGSLYLCAAYKKFLL